MVDHTEAEISQALRCSFSAWFGTQQKEAAVLVSLWRNQGDYMSPMDLANEVHTTPNSLRVMISQLRDSLPAEAIDSVKLRGYRLTEIGMNECMGAIVAQMQILSGASRRIAA